MLTEKIKILLVDDDASIRALLPAILAKTGYDVRSAEDGLAALSAIRQEVPDIIISDLDMPRMSGFELLSVVRRRFPAMMAIAMSGAFHGDELPDWLAADHFYNKGASVKTLLRIVNSMSQEQRPQWRQRSRSAVPIWIAKNGHDPAGAAYVTITCPECCRTFPQTLNEEIVAVHEAECVFCSGLIPYAIVQIKAPVSPPGFGNIAQRSLSGIET